MPAQMESKRTMPILYSAVTSSPSRTQHSMKEAHLLHVRKTNLLNDQILDKGREEDDDTGRYDLRIYAPQVCFEILSCKYEA
jgi:hypothetical protein